MTKYYPLAIFLDKIKNNNIRLSFQEFEKIIQKKLPPASLKERAWWANASSDTTHTWAKVWLDSGWVVSEVDLKDKYVAFVRKPKDETKRYWWVNQNQTYQYEVPGGFLWSPKINSNGNRNQFYENMRLAKPGEIVFSFSNTYIKAVGMVTKAAVSSPKPEFGKSGNNWSKDGWLVEVEFRELKVPIQPKQYINELREFLPKKYSPLQQNGNGLQSVYLACIQKEMASILLEHIEEKFDFSLDESSIRLIEDESLEKEILERKDIGPTVVTQIVEARRGQGIFKTNVRFHESRCRVTGISEIRHLRASHIKPWKDSNDEEKLNGANGLLLAPHIDHLFDRGFISFSDEGELLISKYMERGVLELWNIKTELNVGIFNSEQKKFLAYHRNKVFEKSKVIGTDYS